MENGFIAQWRLFESFFKGNLINIITIRFKSNDRSFSIYLQTMEATRAISMLTMLLFVSMVNGNRIQSDSIMDIINTQRVEKFLKERRANSTIHNEDRFITQNELDEEVTEADPEVYQTPDDIDFDYAPKRVRSPPPPIRGDVIMRYNDSMIPQYLSNFPNLNADQVAELQAYRGDKVLKSSKNALIVTRREYLKKDWCKTEPLIQRIREEGCLTRTIINRFCYGQCNSFYIPKSPKRRRSQARTNHYKKNPHHDFEDEDLTGAVFQSCAFCKPKKFVWVTVVLRCPNLVPNTRRKKIQKIKKCGCMAVPQG